jgi:hypothetical protein
MCTGTIEITGKNGWIRNRVVGEKIVENAIELVGGCSFGFELVQVVVKSGCRGWAALTLEGWHDVKIISGRVRYDMRVGENVETLGAYGINTESIIELEIIIE